MPPSNTKPIALAHTNSSSSSASDESTSFTHTPLPLQPRSPRHSTPLKVHNNILHTHISYHKWQAAKYVINDISASTPDKYGDLPLHMSLKRNAPDRFIFALIDIFDDAVRLPSAKDGALPLHIAAIQCSSFQVVMKLIRKYPEGLDVADVDGDTPRDCVRKSLDHDAKEAIMKPASYWVEIVNGIKEETEIGFVEKIGVLEEKLKIKEEELEHLRRREKTLEQRLDLLEKKNVSSMENLKIEQVDNGHEINDTIA